MQESRLPPSAIQDDRIQGLRLDPLPDPFPDIRLGGKVGVRLLPAFQFQDQRRALHSSRVIQKAARAGYFPVDRRQILQMAGPDHALNI